MDFFIRPIQRYMLEKIVSNNIITPALFIGGNMLSLHLLKYINKSNKITPSLVIDVTKAYIEKATNKFIQTFKQDTDMNTNIDKEFYSNEDYTNTMKDVRNKLEPKWKLKTLIEHTPRGNVIMFYDSYKQGFTYYADSQNIPYHILNAVAMKYVTTYRCRDFFTDDEITPENKASPLIQIHMVEKSKSKDAVNNSNKDKISHAPFAKLKNYKRGNASKPNNDKNSESEKPKRVYYRNKFVCLGPVRNYSIIQKVKKENTMNGFHSNILNNISGETQLQHKVMSYKDFKNNNKD